jgi:hypothetical protein
MLKWEDVTPGQVRGHAGSDAEARTGTYKKQPRGGARGGRHLSARENTARRIWGGNILMRNSSYNVAHDMPSASLCISCGYNGGSQCLLHTCKEFRATSESGRPGSPISCWMRHSEGR